MLEPQPCAKTLLSSAPLCGTLLLLALPLLAPSHWGALANTAHATSLSTANPEQPPGPYAITPQRRALLDTIRFAEGTWKGGRAEGYRVIYGGTLCNSLLRHPEHTVHGRYTSAAAGAYQFLPSTWRAASKRLKLKDFGARSQDMAALYLIDRRGVLGQADRQGLGPAVLNALAREWASIPNGTGASHYGQPVKSRQELVSFYAAALERSRLSARGA